MTYRYLVVIEKAAGGYSAYSPDVPGCVATGKTTEIAKSAMDEAIEFHIEGLAQLGEAIPQPRALDGSVRKID
jgi:predicted RNase H-like HicB family nuclease